MPTARLLAATSLSKRSSQLESPELGIEGPLEVISIIGSVRQSDLTHIVGEA